MRPYKFLVNNGLAKETVYYLSGTLLSGGIPLFFLPFYANLLSEDELGKFSLFLVFVGFATIFCGLSLHGACVRKFYDKERGENDLKQYIFAAVLILFVTSLCFSFATWLNKELVEEVTGLNFSYTLLAVAYIFFRYIFLIVLGQLQVTRRPVAFSCQKILFVAMEHVVSLSLIAFLFAGFESRAWGALLGSFFYFFIALFFLRKLELLTFTTKLSYVRDCLAFGIPLMPHVAGMFLLMNLDKLILAKYFSAAELGLYYVAFTLAAPVGILGETLNRAVVPHLYSMYSNLEFFKSIKLILLFVLLLGLAAMSYSLVVEYAFPYVFNEKYSAVTYVAIILILGQFVRGIYLICSSYITFTKLTVFQSLSTILSIVTVVIYFNFVGLSDFRNVAYCFVAGIIVQALAIIVSAYGVYRYKKVDRAIAI